MGEVHIIGQILSAHEFSKTSLFCKWFVQTGAGWKLLSGIKEGQTQVDSPVFGESCQWGTPIDIHLVTKTIRGWPKFLIQIFHLDSYGRVHLIGYGYTLVPTASGLHKITCYIWRPVGSLTQRITQFFLGGGLQLNEPDKIVSSIDRYKLNTESMGYVLIEAHIVLRSFDAFGVEVR